MHKYRNKEHLNNADDMALLGNSIEGPFYSDDIDLQLFMGGSGELFEDIELCSIERDVARLEANENPTEGTFDNLDTKPEIRNGDLMWWAGGSGAYNNNNSTGDHSAASSYSESSAVPPAIISGSTLLIKHEPDGDLATVTPTALLGEGSGTITVPAHEPQRAPTVVVCKPLPQQLASLTMIKSEPLDDYEQHLQQHSIPQLRQQQEQGDQHIPPGTSLLRSSNNKSGGSGGATLYKKRQQGPMVAAIGNNFVRPDTPHSLYDEVAPDFKHNVDLRACVMGSNNISLTNAMDATYIDLLSRELQNTSKDHVELPYHRFQQPPINDVLDVLIKESSAVEATVAANTPPPTTASSSPDCDWDDGNCSDSLHDSGCGSAASLDGNSRYIRRHISDHSYTRNEMVDRPNMYTPSPSDSDEEIDVVSVNENKLPTNPSDKDRRALQTQVADKISNCTVKTKKGVRTLPPRRRDNYELPCTPASSSPVKSVANSQYPSPSSTPCSQERLLLMPNGARRGGHDMDFPIYRLQEQRARKRQHDSEELAGKKYRGKKMTSAAPSPSLSLSTSSSAAAQAASAAAAPLAGSVTSGGLKRQGSLDETDTIEKRHLHNDMERQRRIGLKNLFEALKRQIPSIKDKERAPKVNILREAAKLCEQLAREEHAMNAQLQLLRDKQRHQQETLAQLRRQHQLQSPHGDDDDAEDDEEDDE